MDVETFVHFLHVLLAVMWVGGAFALQVVATRTMLAREAPGRLPAMASDFEFVGTRIFTPASALLVLTGIWLVVTSDGEFSFSDFWVYASLIAFAYSFLSGALYLSPHLAKAKRVWAAEGPTSEEGARIMRGLVVVSRIELVVLVFIVWDMVVKPFS